jgi:hypothetical protein
MKGARVNWHLFRPESAFLVSVLCDKK